MKKIKIGDKEYDQAETVSDVNIKRYTKLKCFIVEDESGMPIPKLVGMYKKFQEEFDKQSMSGMFIVVYDHLKSLEKLIEDYDPMQMAFALLVSEKGEDLTSVDNTMLMEKIDKFSKAGLDQGTVEEVVTSFLKGLTAR